MNLKPILRRGSVLKFCSEQGLSTYEARKLIANGTFRAYVWRGFQLVELSPAPGDEVQPTVQRAYFKADQIRTALGLATS